MDTEWSVAVLSDIHGNRWALEAILEDIRHRGAGSIFNLGDSIYGPLDPVGTAKILMDEKITSILGNQDRLLVENSRDFANNSSLRFVYSQIGTMERNWLEQLKPFQLFEEEIYMCHGSPHSDSQYLLEAIDSGYDRLKPAAEIIHELSDIPQDIIFCGHSHLARVVYLPDGKIVINPGSVGMPAYFDDIPVPHRMESGNPMAKYTMVHKRKKKTSIEQITIEYNIRAAAEAALDNGFEDWYYFLKSGRCRQ